MQVPKNSSKAIEIDLASSITNLPTKIFKVLLEYAAVIQELKRLPPHRQLDDRINPKERAQPVFIRHYRYWVLQKDIIEKLTQEILDAGII